MGSVGKYRAPETFVCRVDATRATDENKSTPMDIASKWEYPEIAFLLCRNADELPNDIKIQQLSKLMYKEDKREAEKEFSDILASLDPKLVSR